jgi:hypothetical protein
MCLVQFLLHTMGLPNAAVLIEICAPFVQLVVDPLIYD